MLPDYPRIKRKVRRRFESLIREQIHHDPLLSLMRIQYAKEGDRATIRTMEGYTQQINYEEISEGFKLVTEELIAKGPDVLIAMMGKVVEGMQRQQSEQLIRKMQEATQRTGNIINAQSKPLSPYMVLEALEKMQIDFDEHGNPIMPVIVVNKEHYNKILSEMPKFERDPELYKRTRELIEKKRKEWFDRESNRKLVE